MSMVGWARTSRKWTIASAIRLALSFSAGVWKDCSSSLPILVSIVQSLLRLFQ
jgi:hypothetical protein